MSVDHAKSYVVLPDYRDVVAFHSSVLLLGGLVVMPIIYVALAALGALGKGVSELLSSYSYGSLVLLSVATLLPSVIAYGRNLAFAPSRLLIGLAIVVILALRFYAELGASMSLPLPLGGGVLGVAIATGLGRAAVLARSKITLKQAGRYSMMAIGLFFALVVVGTAAGTYISDRVWEAQSAPGLASWTRRLALDVSSLDVRGSGDVLDSRQIPHKQLLYVRLDDEQTVVIPMWQRYLQLNDEDPPECQLPMLNPGDRVQFEGTFFEPTNRYISDFGDIDFTSVVGVIDASPCDFGEPRNFGSIDKVDAK